MRFWGDWKEFNEEFDLCEVGIFFKIKTVTFAIEENDSSIDKIYFAFERMSVAKRDGLNENVYFSPNDELKKDTIYIVRVKSYNGVNYSEWSNTECYMTGKDDLSDGAVDLSVSGERLRQINEVKFNWVGEQNILKYDNTTINGVESGTTRSREELIEGKQYFWKIKGTQSKNSENSFAINIKPQPPTFD